MINVRVTERQLAEIDAVWKLEKHTSRSKFARHGIRDATAHPGPSCGMLASIVAEEYAMRMGEGDSVYRENVIDDEK